MLQDNSCQAAWLESKRLLVSPEHHIDALQRLLTDVEDALLMYDYDLVSDPQTVAIVRAQQRAGGQRRRRLKRLGGASTVRDVTCPSDINGGERWWMDGVVGGVSSAPGTRLEWPSRKPTDI
ncbi:hypothetical protein [Streptomyces sp. NPDC001743]|uniref:hypothetical protein n=1 Tax=Streptomyces sp. NPDC001743 TaxID=3154397 RepID=UPI00332C4B2F